jgi:hypothetical protein
VKSGLASAESEVNQITADAEKALDETKPAREEPKPAEENPKQQAIEQK